MERPNAWLTYSDVDMQDLENVAKKYRHFLDVGKNKKRNIVDTISAVYILETYLNKIKN